MECFFHFVDFNERRRFRKCLPSRIKWQKKWHFVRLCWFIHPCKSVKHMVTLTISHHKIVKQLCAWNLCGSLPQHWHLEWCTSQFALLHVENVWLDVNIEWTSWLDMPKSVLICFDLSFWCKLIFVDYNACKVLHTSSQLLASRGDLSFVVVRISCLTIWNKSTIRSSYNLDTTKELITVMWLLGQPDSELVLNWGHFI